MKARDRYFVINRWVSKGGHTKSRIYEYTSWELATQMAFGMATGLIELSGELVEEFIVFVGSKTAVDKLYGHKPRRTT